MDKYPPLRLLLERDPHKEIPRELLYLPVLDGRSANWEPSVLSLAQAGRNFVIALPNPEADVPRLCEIIQAEHCVPERMQKWTAYALRSAFWPEHFDLVRSGIESGHPWFLIEQIKLLPKHRPDQGNYLIYCELMGIITEHHDLEDAKRTIARYYAAFPPAALLPLAGIYEWKDGQWHKTRIFF